MPNPLLPALRGHQRGTKPLVSDPKEQFDPGERIREAKESRKRRRPTKKDKNPTVPTGNLKINAVPEKPDPLVETINRRLDVPLPRLHFIVQLISPRGGGKTTLLINFIMRFYFQIFHAVFVVSPTLNNDSKWESVPLNPERKFVNPGPANIDKVITAIEGLPKKDLKLVIFDDCIGKGMRKKDRFYDFIFRHRHLRTSIISCAQNFKFVEKPVRGNTTHYALFSVWNQKEVEDIAEELGMSWERLMALMPTEKYAFLWVDRVNNAIYKNLDEYLGPVREPPSYELVGKMAKGEKRRGDDSDGSSTESADSEVPKKQRTK